MRPMTKASNSVKNVALAATLATSVASGAVADESVEAQNIAVSNNYFTAVQTGDLATLGALVAPDVVWHQPGQNQFSGTQNGAEAVFGVIGGMMQISGGTFKIDEVSSIMANGDQVAAILKFSAQREGAEMSMSGVDVMTISKGQIKEVWLYSGDQAAENAFWGN